MAEADLGNLYTAVVSLDEPRELARHLRNCAVLGGAHFELAAGQVLQLARLIEDRPVVVTVIEERPAFDPWWSGALLAVLIIDVCGTMATELLRWWQ